ncbi:MAG: indole-3-glycerol phosphate synthase TrpC [Candidatus Omnitrophica bacterium]|nr:indole-3-glycerol phosphate synthase TrpC [Candidatus Omnitrophota bacterium]
MSKNDMLKEIVAKKKEKLAFAKIQLPEEELKVKAQGQPATRPFIKAITKERQISLIAEIKRASPTHGVIRESFDHKDIAKIYQDAGVQAISVLTEEDYFLGNISFLNDVKSATTVPILRKDFIFEPYQVYESRCFGADAILLIADMLTQETISGLIQVATSLGMDCLVEVHTEKELKKVLKLKEVQLIGINNRDLHTLEVDPKTTERLYTLIPKGKPVVVESGLRSRQDVSFLKILGVSAVLVGSVFMESENIRAKVEEVMGW